MKQINYIKTLFTLCVFLYISCSSSNINKEEEQQQNEEATETKILPPDNFSYIFAEKPSNGKDIYIPNELKNNDFDSNESRWSYQRSASSDNIIVLWEKGFGQYPNKTSRTNLRVNVEELLNMAENYYAFYRDTMKFVIKGNSQTDKYRMIVMLIYQEDWLATGAGYDNVIGALWINPSTTKIPAVIGHEFGHSFQYQTHCDGNYGFRDQNYVGTFWEQCAQYMSWQQNNESYTNDIPFFLENAHKNFSHEDIRYQSIYLMEYWKEKHGIDFLGKLWREAKTPEHPLDAYKRITKINQDELNDEIFEYACKNISWDYPLGTYNKDFIKNLSTTDKNKYTHKTILSSLENNYYKISNNQIPQSYGYNAIKLSIPPIGTNVIVNFEGLESQWTSIEGWRYGFVVVKEDNTAIYGTMQKTKQGISSITIPENAKELWLVVTGAPSVHENHVWDDNSENDETFPYRVKFTNTTIE